MTARRPPLKLVWLINAALLLLLIACWTLLGRTQWKAPAPLIPDYAAMLEQFQKPGHLLAAEYPNMTEKPLFEADRKWPEALPPPEEAPKAPPPPETNILDSVTVLGIYEHATAGTVIIEVNGKSQRLRVGDELEGWRLIALNPRTVEFQGTNEQKRELTLKRFIPTDDADTAANRRPQNPPAGAATRPRPRPNTGAAR